MAKSESFHDKRHALERIADYPFLFDKKDTKGQCPIRIVKKSNFIRKIGEETILLFHPLDNLKDFRHRISS